MKVFLIILAVIAAAVLGFLLYGRISILREQKLYRELHPYVLSSLSAEERKWLSDLYERSLVSESGTFRGGGVWRREPTFYQRQLVGDIYRGRLDQTGLNTVQSLLVSLMDANKDNEQAKNLLNIMLMKIGDYTYSTK